MAASCGTVAAMTTAPARSPKDVAVIGAGSYGTCLAILAASAGHRVDFWCRGAAAAAELEATRENKLYLPGFTLPLSKVFAE